ncbi:Transcriptional adapter 2 [Astathelohania contejeani]|uniref:Transcriptional adapter 2 n=1 Tax=Astathelohania contejeani TaxID=164912 RepID=A0ABQ7HZ93_9MICR|nr:Transcriptional adapter 2 [Thelohania contejeani]
MTVTRSKSHHKNFILCDNCYSDITELAWIQCVECENDCCTECFYNIHKDLSHTSRYIEPLVFPVFEGNWTALDELFFIEALFRHGIGNWADIAEYINKSEEDVEEHYYNILKKKNAYIDEVVADKPITEYSNPTFHSVSTYMPLRKDFEVEYEDEYEKRISNIMINENDSTFKKIIHDGYKNIMQLRNFYKYVIFDRQLIEAKDLIKNEKELDKEELHILNEIKCLMPYISKKDFNLFFQGLCIENKLIDHINVFEYKKTSTSKNYVSISEFEKKICERMKMTEDLYFRIKKKCIKEFVKKGKMSLKRMMALLECEDERIEILYKYFVEMGWIVNKNTNLYN